MTTQQNGFDDLLDAYDRSVEAPPGLTASAAYVHDTIKLAQASAKDIFDGAATPDIALAIYDRIAAVHRPGYDKEADRVATDGDYESHGIGTRAWHEAGEEGGGDS